MERILTCNGIARFGHCDIIAAAVKYKETGPNQYHFNGMIYLTFADQDVASLFQSYWCERAMYSSQNILDVNGNVTREGLFRNIQVGSASVVGQQHYHNAGPHNRTFTRWGPDVWAFWEPCRNQTVNRAGLGLPALPTHFQYDNREVTVTTREF